MCAAVFCRELIKGRLYPNAARKGRYAYANEVSMVQGRIVSKYLSIVKLPVNASVEEKEDIVETAAETNVVENGGEADISELRNGGNIPRRP